MLPIVARFSVDGESPCIPTPIELKQAMVLFMDLVTNGDFTPLVKRPPYIGIRPASFPSVEEAKQQRVPLSKQIFNNYNLLKMPMQRHETLFISAWKKNSVNLRTNVFEKEWSEMNRNHNMAFKDMLNWRAPTEQSCKWPPIIVEDFSYKDSFLVFLKSRASVGPSAFYWLDKESWQIGVGANIIKVPYLSD